MCCVLFVWGGGILIEGMGDFLITRVLEMELF
jgi:hypothetical protein